MGHERIGFLPRTKEWNRLTQLIAEYDGDLQAVKTISNQTLQAIRQTYEKMPYDESVIKAIQFIATLSVSASKQDQLAFLRENGYTFSSEPTVYSILANANRIITTQTGSLEINKLVRDSVMQAVIEYDQSKRNNDQISFFSDSSQGIWMDILPDKHRMHGVLAPPKRHNSTTFTQK